MTLDDALMRLGVDRTATPEAVRRAYLRLLKTHRPESDPEGFRALRDAYDLARRALVVLSAPVATPTGPALELSPSATTGDATARRPAFDGRVSNPSTPVVLDSRELDEWLEKRDLDRAAATLAQMYDAAATSMLVLVPRIGVTLDLLLSLHALGHAKAARTLRDAALRWFEVSGAEAKLLTGAMGAQWKIIGEFEQMSPQVSLPTRSAIVALARGTPWKDVERRLHAYESVSWAAAGADANLLAEQPSLPSSKAIANALRGVEASSPNLAPKRSLIRSFALAAGALLFGIPMLVQSFTGEAIPPRAAATASSSHLRVTGLLAWESVARILYDIDEHATRAGAEKIVAEVRPLGAAVNAALIKIDGAGQVDGSVCKPARQEANHLRVLAASAVDARLTEDIRELEEAVTRLCPLEGGGP